MLENTSERLVVSIPFCGFYYSLIDDEINHDIEYFFGVDGVYHSVNDSEESKRSQKLYEDNCEAFNFRAIREEIAKSYAQWFSEDFEWEISTAREEDECIEDFDLHLEFDSLHSPRFYNYETDKIYVSISAESFRQLVEKFSTHPAAIQHIKNRLTPSSGFMPFYSADLSQWGDFSEWECAQSSLFLEAVTYAVYGEEGYQELLSGVSFLNDNGGEVVFNAVSNNYEGEDFQQCAD